MAGKYEKSVQMSREEEGSYHRRQVEHLPPREKTYTTTSESYEIVPNKSRHQDSMGRKQVVAGGYSSDEGENYDEWTTSKRKVNHKTRQVETRVSRQLLVEDGRVIADSGPQVTTRIKEDNKVEECEKEKAPKNRARFEALDGASEGECAGGRVLGEKKEIQRVTREVREENMQYHDERFKELTGPEVHRSAIKAPHELITINDSRHSSSSAPRGKMVHYSQRGKKTRDTDEILEVAKLAIDGSITKEVKRTRHHEESSEDEKPDETGEAEALRREPIKTRSTRRGADYVNDFDNTSISGAEAEEDVSHHKKSSSSRLVSSPKKSQHHSSSSRQHHHHQDDAAFPRYQPEAEFDSYVGPESGGRQLPLERRQRTSSSSSSSDDDDDYRRRHRQYTPTRAPIQQHSYQTSARPVEIPEEYRVKHKTSSRQQQPLERSVSPSSKFSSSRHHNQQPRHHYHSREDASVQAHLSDEEERRSLRSNSSSNLAAGNQHERQARQLQRQSTQGSRRNYYYGEPKQQMMTPANNRRPKSPATISSSSSSDLSDPKERQRQQGVRSRDSGFKSPHGGRRTATPISSSQQDGQQIYSVSSKSRRQHQQQPRELGAASPTPSAGQRSVKTTMTTMSAGLEDQPAPRRPQRSNTTTGGKMGKDGKVSKPPSPFQKLAQMFAPSAPKAKRQGSNKA